MPSVDSLELTFRKIRRTDRAFIRRLSADSFAAYSTDPEAVVASMIDEPNGRSEVALITTPTGETRAGLMVLQGKRLPGSFGPWDRPLVAKLQAIAVAPEVRGRGVGRNLCLRAERLARDAGAVALTLLTAENNLTAQRLFVRMGFQVVAPIGVAYARQQRGIAMHKTLCVD